VNRLVVVEVEVEVSVEGGRRLTANAEERV
jgi:autonomous glycyl radical cofactor GrcA